MNGYEIYRQAMNRLGYTETPRLRALALTAINQVYSDLWYCCSAEPFEPLGNLSEKIRLSERTVCDIMPAGVAAFLSQSESDGDAQQLWISIYNRKRAALTRVEKRTIEF